MSRFYGGPRYNRGPGRGFVGRPGFGFGGFFPFGAPFLGGFLGSFLGNAIYPQYPRYPQYQPYPPYYGPYPPYPYY
ncbi:uroporphyrin-III methyltransferase [Lysinibacillus sp. 54212]|uniref:uroporphyrin-III methyltransferase n=1 Tax=Lysinibacillus sp. 54212 TaxID=3119829 RepID=UPI002FC76DCB